MRKRLVVAVLLGVANLSPAQPPESPATRYGVAANLDPYPQATPQEALASVLKALDKGKFEYLTAHLLEPKFLDDRIVERGRTLELQVEKDLIATREAQRRNPNPVPRDERIPDEPKEFAEAVRREAQQRAFRLVARDVEATLSEHPEHAKVFRTMLRDGQFLITGDNTTVTTKNPKDRPLSLKRVAGRWYVEDPKEPTSGGGKK